jgi:hypothetical protein
MTTRPTTVATTPLRVGLPPLPDRMKYLPRDDRGFPVPWFVQWTDLVSDRPTPFGEGRPRFNVVDAAKWERAIREKRCWICGERLGARRTFVVGPIAAINRCTAEPPAHNDCALFAAQACPFLVRPRMTRLPKPEGDIPPPGELIDRNPGVVCLWSCRDFQILQTDRGQLIRIGKPEEVLWFAEGKPAGRATVLDSINLGLPALRTLAAEDGVEATAGLNRMITAAMMYIPRF